VLGDPGRAYEHRAQRPSGYACKLDVALKAVQLAPERVALRAYVHQPEMLAVEHDQPRARAEHGHPPPAHKLAQRLAQTLALDPERHRRRLAAGEHEPVQPVEVTRHAHLTHARTQPEQHS
jgi:hypothetical protein